MPYWFDGNNLMGRSAEAARRDRRTRRAFLELLGTYSTGRSGRFLVFFDGDDRDRSMPPRGVRIRYAAPRSCDDAIVAGVEGARNPSEIIVVTNDRELGSRCRNAGTRIMTWSDFVARMQKRIERRPGRGQQDGSVDLDDWSKYFGFDPDDLE